MVYNIRMITIHTTEIFDAWFSKQDKEIRARIDARLIRVELGNFGDVKPVGEGVSELRFHIRSGIRVYFVQHGKDVIVLLAGGNKSSQAKDIENAQKLAKQLEED